uniref:Heparanase-like protein 3 n=1 Tax=Anthurium amnicola TaxID=1678845 RepID=A0A1D1XRU8_9ARAE
MGGVGHISWLLLLLVAAGPVPLLCRGSSVGGAGSASGGVIEGTAFVEGRYAIGTTDDDFVCATLDWWPPEKCDFGWCSWGRSSLLNLDLSSTMLLNAIKEFSPLKLRLGGSLQDKVIYDTGDPEEPCIPFVKNSSEMFGFTQSCLPMSRWDSLNNLFREAGAVVIFGLNALNGRIPLSDGSLGGPWDSTNAASLIRYTVNKGYTIHGWELGNELSGSGIGARIGAEQYAADVKALKKIVNDIYYAFPKKPLVLAPGGFFHASWFKDIVDKTKPNFMDVITHHIYNLGPGVDGHLIEKILDPSYLDSESTTFSNLQGILRNSSTSTTAWVGEAGGAWNSGHNLVTNAFVFSFWYLDQLGMSAAYDTRTYCRQTLIGGNYGLLNTTTYEPNPDYYSALLWHRLMGQRALRTKFTGTNKIRAYAHCSRQSQGITLLLINLDSNNTVQVTPTTDSVLIRATRHGKGVPRTRFNRVPRAQKMLEFMRDEYHLTAKDGNLHSQAMLLNGNILAVDSNWNIPVLEPVKVNSSEPITVSPFSIVFAHIPHFYAPACK